MFLRVPFPNFCPTNLGSSISGLINQLSTQIDFSGIIISSISKLFSSTAHACSFSPINPSIHHPSMLTFLLLLINLTWFKIAPAFLLPRLCLITLCYFFCTILPSNKVSIPWRFYNVRLLKVFMWCFLCIIVFLAYHNVAYPKCLYSPSV